MGSSRLFSIFSRNSVVIASVVVLFLALAFGVYAFVTFQNNESPDVAVRQTDEVKRLVVLVSSDGLGLDYMGEDTPFLQSLLSRPFSSNSVNMQTIEQSETMPSHISMISGLTQSNHGFYANSVNESTPPLGIKNVFDYAKEEGYAYFAFMTKDKLLHLFGGSEQPNVLSIEQQSSDVLDDIDELVTTSSSKVAVFIHFRDPDSSGHVHGWGSAHQKSTIQNLDKSLELLVADLNAEFSEYERYFIFTADHGGEGFQHSDGCPACRRIPFIIYAENVTAGYPLPKVKYDIYDTACVMLDIMQISKDLKLDCSINP